MLNAAIIEHRAEARQCYVTRSGLLPAACDQLWLQVRHDEAAPFGQIQDNRMSWPSSCGADAVPMTDMDSWYAPMVAQYATTIPVNG